MTIASLLGKGAGGLVGNYAVVKMQGLGDEFVKLLANDPDLAKARILQMNQHADELALVVSKAQGVVEEAQQQYDTKKSLLDRDNALADKYAALMQARTDANDAAGAAEIEAKLERVVSEVEKLTGELATAKKRLDTATQDVISASAVHRAQVDQAAKAQSMFDEGQDALRHAKDDAARAAERKRMAQSAAGLRVGLGSADPALEAVKAATKEALERARADNMTADALGASHVSGIEDLVAADAAADAPKLSAVERLAAARAKQV